MKDLDKDLKQLKYRLHRSSHQDGILEVGAAIILGYFLQMNGRYWPSRVDWIAYGIFALFTIISIWWNRKIVFPRTGIFGFAAPKPGFRVGLAGFGKSMIFALLGGAVIAIILILIERSGIAGPKTSEFDPLLRSRNSLLFFFLMFLSPRLLGEADRYPLLFGGALVLWILGCDIFHAPNLIAIGVPSGTLLVVGVMKVARFLRENPRIEEGAQDDPGA